MPQHSGTLLIVVTGAPAAGKTTVGRRISQAFGLPFIHKDSIKEILYDALGWGDRDWSRQLGAASMELLFHFAEVELQAGRSCIVEANFYPEFHSAKLLALKQKHAFEPLQVVCTANAEILRQRWRERVRSRERHPGHVDQVLADEFSFGELHNKFRALPIGGRVIEVDTTDFERIDYASLFQSIESEVQRLSDQ